MSNRRLDALFEERVLGVTFNDSANPFRMMPNYTTSLDAAWVGVEKVPLPAEFWITRDEDDGMFWVSFHRNSKKHESCEDHPALALVKALLYAVGVTQEEIDGCE